MVSPTSSSGSRCRSTPIRSCASKRKRPTAGSPNFSRNAGSASSVAWAACPRRFARSFPGPDGGRAWRSWPNTTPSPAPDTRAVTTSSPPPGRAPVRRWPKRDYGDELLRRFQAAAEGAATATGCRVTVTPEAIVHEPLRPNTAMAELFGANLERIGFPEDPEDPEAGYGSTDCGNVSQA